MEVIFRCMPGWEEHLAREVARYEDGESRLPEEPDARQRQLTRIGNAAAQKLLPPGRSSWVRGRR